MRIAYVQFSPWDRIYNCDPQDFSLQVGNKVIARSETGVELGEVVDFSELSNKNNQEDTQDVSYTIIRLATPEDILALRQLDEKKEKAMNDCKQLIHKHNLPMKLVDVRFALDEKRLTFAFIADGRVDFRDLVKDLTRHFQASIRLQQIGIRDEAKMKGDYGHCGLPLCCTRFLKDLTSITSEMAEIQQCSHRGSERLSGVCGRLMCCLAYEQEGYEELAKKLPPIGEKIRYEGKIGVVVGHHVLKQTIDVEFEAENGEEKTVIEVEDWKK
jgi:cell fate regulator YaaT (PSP1 superfamily)